MRPTSWSAAEPRGGPSGAAGHPQSCGSVSSSLQRRYRSLGCRLCARVSLAALQHRLQRIDGSGVVLGGEAQRCSFAYVTVVVLQERDQPIDDAGISGRSERGSNRVPRHRFWVAQCTEYEIRCSRRPQADQRADGLVLDGVALVSCGVYLQDVDQSHPLLIGEVAGSTRPDPDRRVEPVSFLGVLQPGDRGVDAPTPGKLEPDCHGALAQSLEVVLF